MYLKAADAANVCNANTILQPLRPMQVQGASGWEPQVHLHGFRAAQVLCILQGQATSPQHPCRHVIGRVCGALSAWLQPSQPCLPSRHRAILPAVWPHCRSQKGHRPSAETLQHRIRCRSCSCLLKHQTCGSRHHSSELHLSRRHSACFRIASMPAYA